MSLLSRVSQFNRNVYNTSALSLAIKNSTTTTATVNTNDVYTQQQRYASSKQLRIRMNAVNNIKKITKAMKMVASAKLRKSEEALKIARNFAASFNDILPAQENAIVDAQHTDADKSISNKNYLVIALSADRGLCGSVNGQLIRNTKYKLNNLMKVTDNINLIVLGEKAKSGLERGYVKNFILTVSDYTKIKRMTFKQALTITDYYLNTEFEQGEIMFNKFKNLIAFQTTSIPIYPHKQQLEDSKIHEKFELEGGADLLDNLIEFRYAVLFYHLFAEGEATELSQRVNAMTNSSKNASEMLDELRLLYNRGRQAQITTELIEIISGAAAAEAQKKQA